MENFLNLSLHSLEELLKKSLTSLEVVLNPTRHGKSRKHASVVCGQFLRKLWTFLDKQQFSCSFYPSMPTILHYYPQLLNFCRKISDIMGKNAICGMFTS